MTELETSFAVTLPGKPYPGLRPFEKTEWPIFFGRERMADAIVSRLLKQQVLVIHGDSGCGKSSLIRAGVLPRLEHESAFGGARWRTCIAAPQEAPLWNLAEALAELSDDNQHQQDIIDIRRVLNYGRSGPAELARLLNTSENNRVCILIDQFEELFEHAHRHGREEAHLLTEFLVSMLESQPEGLYAILTMRSEFLGACARFEGFAEAVNATQYLLPRMSHEDLMRAICEPAQLFDGEISPALADRLVADSKGSQDQLPLIQHALMLLCREQSTTCPLLENQQCSKGPAWTLELEHYLEKGGIAHLLSSHADSVQAQAEGEYLLPGSRVVEDLFRALTGMNADGQAIRRPCTLETLIKVTGSDERSIRGVIDHFRAEGTSFLRPYGNQLIELNDLVDVSHEALIRCWAKISAPVEGWVNREFRTGLVWRALLVQADSYEKNDRDVLSSIATGERERWMLRRNAEWARRYGGEWDRVQDLLKASIVVRDREVALQVAARDREEALRLAERDREETERTAQRDRQEELQLREVHESAQRTKYRILKIFSAVIFVLSVGATYLWFDAKQESLKFKRERAEADIQLSLANAARERTEELAQNNKQSAQSLQEVKKSLEKLQVEVESTNPTSDFAQTLDKVNTQLSNEVGNLDRSRSIAAPPQIYSKIPNPRVYIQISSEQQRSDAQELRQDISSLQINNLEVMVPGIELVTVALRRNELRCFKTADCEAGELLRKKINDLLVEPSVQLVDLSERYGGSESIRDSHYELWFAPGKIGLKRPHSLE
ncbi:hypothetical protein PMI29_01951 [Pseudomonas sp. GM49]|nr:hypothetical protein PMI29_01951 [Pseudomonas sp. GM49]